MSYVRAAGKEFIFHEPIKTLVISCCLVKILRTSNQLEPR